jgi:hypothetical protein
MPTNFPTGVDTFVNPTPTDSLNAPAHSTQHTNANDAIEAIENAIISPVTYPDQLVNGTTATVRPIPFATAAALTTAFTGSATITFPVGRFTQSPICVVVPLSSTSGATSTTIGGISAASFGAYNWSGSSASAASRQVFYIAHQMTSAAGAG